MHYNSSTESSLYCCEEEKRGMEIVVFNDLKFP